MTLVPAIFVPVKLTSEDGVIVDSTITDCSGRFEFLHVAPNETYMLHFGMLLCMWKGGACINMHPTGIHIPIPVVSVDGESNPQSGVLLLFLLCMDAIHFTSRRRPR